MIKKIFVDSDIILDVLAKRNGFYEPAARLFDLGFAKKLDLYTSAIVMANIFYVLRKKHGCEKSMEQLRKLRMIIKIVPVTEKTVDDALISKIRDFEDGLQYYSAKENAMQVIITRNIKDYREKDVMAQSAEEYLKIHYQETAR